MSQYSNYPQNYESPEQVCRRLMANHGDVGKVREIVSMSGCTDSTKKECYDFLDTLEQRQTDALVVDGDTSDIGGY